MLPRTLLHQWTSNLQIVRHFSASSAVDKTGLIKQLRERSGLGITDVKVRRRSCPAVAGHRPRCRA